MSSVATGGYSMSLRAAWACVGLLATACTTPQYDYRPAQEAFSHPPLGERVTVAVGEPMLAQGNIVQLAGIDLPGRVSISGYTLHGGFYPQTGSDEEGRSFHRFGDEPGDGAAAIGALTKNFIVDPAASIRASQDGQLCVVTILNVSACQYPQFSYTSRAIAHERAFQQTLIYSGRSGSDIHMAYREFDGDIARPAFANAARYDLTASREIGYRGALIEVIEADNLRITYRVIRNFNTREASPGMPIQTASADRPG